MKINSATFHKSVWILLFQLLVMEVFIILLTKGVYYGITLFIEAERSLFYEQDPIYWIFRVIEISLIVWLTLNWASFRYEVSEDKLSLSHGVFITKTETFVMDNIESVKLKISFWGMIFGFGSLVLYAPTLKETIRIKNIIRAKKASQMIANFVAKKKKQTSISVS